jgi:hypothetical protein
VERRLKRARRFLEQNGGGGGGGGGEVQSETGAATTVITERVLYGHCAGKSWRELERAGER